MAGAAPSPRHTIFNNFSGQFNVTFITITSTSTYSSLPEKQSITRQAILAFGVSNLLSILQLKYQGKPDSPFDTHPITTRIAIISFLIYCFLVYWLGYDAEPKMIPTTMTRRTCAKVIHQAVRPLGYFSLAAFASILFVVSPLYPFVYLGFALFSAWLMHRVNKRGGYDNPSRRGYDNPSRRIVVPLIQGFVHDRYMLPV